MADKKFISRMDIFKPKGLATVVEGRIYSKGMQTGGAGDKKYLRTNLMVSNREKQFEYMAKTLNTDPVYKTENEGNVTHFLEVVAFGRTAEAMEKVLSAGAYVMLIGDTDVNENDKGVKRAQLTVNDFKLVKAASEKGDSKTEKVETVKTEPKPAPVKESVVEEFDDMKPLELDDDDLPF